MVPRAAIVVKLSDESHGSLIMIGRFIVLWGLLSVAPSLFAADPFIGAWKLTKSTQKDHKLGRVLQYLNINGGTAVIEPDGQSTYHRFGAEARLADHQKSRIMVMIFKREGRDVAKLTRKISADGRRLTETAKGIGSDGKRFHYVDVYEKQ